MQTVIVLVLVTLSVAYAQIPTPCSAPRQMEARIMQVHRTEENELRGKLTYDAYNKRWRLVEEVNIHERRDFYDTIFLSEFGTEYVINLRTRKCVKKPLSHTFGEIGIPSNATFYGEFYLGDMLLMQSWAGTVGGLRCNLFWTVHDCVPVIETCHSGSVVIVTTYYDVTLGIRDPNVFIPPKECL